MLIPALPDFMARYPEIQIALGVSDHSVNLIRNNVDCVIRGGALDDSSLIARHIGYARMMTCATPAYLKQYGIPAYPEELKNRQKLKSNQTSALMKVMCILLLDWQDWALSKSSAMLQNQQ